MGLLSNKNDKYFSFGGKKYAINLKNFKKECVSTQNDIGNHEVEISQSYEPDDDTGEMILSQKVDHETTIYGNDQGYTIVYDLVKLLIVSLLEFEGSEIPDSLGMMIAINTLLKSGILEEVE